MDNHIIRVPKVEDLVSTHNAHDTPHLPEAPRIDDEIRGRQIHRMERNLVGGMLGFLVAALFSCIFFWREWSALLAPWAIVVVVVGGARLLVALRASRRAPTPYGPRVVWRFAAFNAATALTLPTAAVWIMFHSQGMDTLYMALGATTIFWAGALAHISFFPSAVTFIGMQAVLWVAVATLTGWDRDTVGIVLLFCASATVALTISRQLSLWLEDGLRQQIELERRTRELQHKTETIGLLLREHEEETSDWLWQVDVEGRLRHVSSRFADAFSRPASEMEATPLLDVLTASGISGNADACQSLSRNLTRGCSFRDLIVPGTIGDGHRWWSLSGRPTCDSRGRRTGTRGVMSDVTSEQNAKAEVSHLAHYDALTDLPNRPNFLRRLQNRLGHFGTDRLAVIYLDLDGFKPVNDRHGHAVGDALLVEVARRLQSATSNSDLVARLGGDEFVVKTRIVDQERLAVFCKRLIETLKQPIVIEGVELVIGASLGIALAPDDGATADILLRNADAALYRAKAEGRDTYRFFAPELDEEMRERARLLQDLRKAVTNDELILHYQPFVDARTGQITGYEALIRWNHPLRGLVSPLDFVPLAEDSGLIVPIGAWVIRTACAQAAAWDDGRRVSVNISPVQFHDRELPDRILTALLETGLPAHRLEVELTESIFLSDIDQALTMLRRIRTLGVRVALDDFGTGYSSLSYLQSFPFDKIKIDRSFVRDLSTRPDSQVIVRAVGDIARGLNMTVTAEGVETLEQAALLQTAGCHELQGYLYGRPTAPVALTSQVEQSFSAREVLKSRVEVRH